MKRFLFGLGLFGFAAQAVLARQFMAVFAGNELTLGIAVSAWLLWEALGAYIAGRTRWAHDAQRLNPLPSIPSPSQGEGKGEGGVRRFSLLAALAIVASLAATLAVVPVRRFIGLASGETLPIPLLVVVIFAFTLIPAFTHGLLFVAAAARLGSGGRAYLWRGAGTGTAGLLLTALFALGAPTLHVLAIGALPLAAFLPATLLSVPSPSQGKEKDEGGARRRVLPWLSVPVLLMLAIAGTRLERSCWQLAWPGYEARSVVESRFGLTVSLERAGSPTVLYDGVPVHTSPALDPLAAEELVSVPLLAADNPRRLLLIGQALGAPAAAALRWPELQVTFVQPDDRLTRAISIADTVAARQLRDPRLKCVAQDPVAFLRATTDTFDCIILLQPAPATLAASRFFTADFYRLCRLRLAPDGVLATPGPGDPTALSPDLAGLLSFRRSELASVFAHVQPIALDFPLLIASDSVLPDRSLAIGHWFLLDSSYVASLLSPLRQQQLLAALDRPHPSARSELFTGLVRESRLSSPGLGRLYAAAGRIRPWLLWLVASALAVVVSIVSLRRGAGFAVPYAILSSGFAGAALPTLVLFAWQLRLGTVYFGLALLTAAFMGGTVLGSWAGLRASRPWFTAADALLGLLTAVLALVTGLHAPALVLLNLLAGLALGAQFALATRAQQQVGRRTGAIAALDLAGGFLGGLVAALFLVPVFGLAAAALALVALKATSIIGLDLARAGGHLTA